MNRTEYSYPCPACGFLSFDEPPGSYAICDLYGWEDDHVQLVHPRMRGGANGESLVEWQRDALKEYPLGIQEASGYHRDLRWRPLTEKDAQVKSNAPKRGLDYFYSAATEEPEYYWLNDAT